MISDSDTHPQGGDSEAAPFMGSEGRQASPNPSQASTAEPVGENGLKPCWSCGGSDAHIAQIAGEMPHLYPIVKCKTCRNRGLPANTEAEAIAAWNTRASPQTEAAPVAGQNNALADELEALITAATPGDLTALLRAVDGLVEGTGIRGIVVENASGLDESFVTAGGLLKSPRSMIMAIRSRTSLPKTPGAYLGDIK